MSTCTNCNQQLLPKSYYCPNCGQSITQFQRPIKSILTEMLHESLDIDGRLSLSLKTLFLKPGFLTLEYCNGKRQKYTPPLRMYLVISIIFFLLLSFLSMNDGEINGNLFLHPEYYPKLMFVLLPAYALLLQVFFRGTFYISNLIFSIHIHCMSYLAFMIMFPLEAYEYIHPIFIAIQIPIFFYLIVYTALAMKNYYVQSWQKIIVKLIAISLSYIALLTLCIKLITQFFSISV